MTHFIGGHADETITPDAVSSTVRVVGQPGRPSAADDVIRAGAGNDVVAGGAGDDTAYLGSGDDSYLWQAGDGDDFVDGGKGWDTFRVAGSAEAERIELAAGPMGTARMTRGDAGDAATLAAIESVVIRPGDGRDIVFVRDLGATAVREVVVDLSGSADPAAADGARDTVGVVATAGADTIELVGGGSSVSVIGAGPVVHVRHADADDVVQVFGGDGEDTIDASTLLADAAITIDAGTGSDTVFGSRGADKILAGAGNDAVVAGAGDDLVLLGAGNDRFVWNPGDGSDVIEGELGTDDVEFNGSHDDESIALTAAGSRARLARDIDDVVLNLGSVEHVRIAAAGGDDHVVIGDLAGSGVRDVTVELGADGRADTVVVRGSAGADRITLSLDADGRLVIDGLAARTVLAGFDPFDTLRIDGLGGDDVLDATALDGAPLQIVFDGGAGDDVLLAVDGAVALLPA